MKPHHILPTVLASSLLTGVLSGQSLPDGAVPAGSLNVSANHSVDTRSSLNAAVQYPQAVKDLVEITSKNQLLTKQRTRLRLRVAGAALQSGGTNLPVALWAQVGNGPWEILFHGNSRDVDAQVYLMDRTIETNTVVNFAARGRTINGAWEGVRSTMVGDVALTALVRGDSAAAVRPESMKSFLTQHVSSDHFVTMGSREILYLFELETRDTGRSAFDMQDIVTVVTLEAAK